MEPKSRTLLTLACLTLVGLMGRAEAANPTLTTISDLPGAVEDTPFVISHALLLAASDADDADTGSATLQFRFKSDQAGTLRDGSNAVVGNNDTLGPGESWTWTPDTNDNGTIAAFKVRAYDGSGQSNADVQVSIIVAAVNDPPVFNSISVLNGANEDNPTTISHADLVAATSITDPDDTTFDFVFKGISSGILTLPGGAPVILNQTLSSGQSWVWTPATNANGELSAFSIRISDGDDESTGQKVVEVQVDPVNDPPDFDFAAPVLPAVDEDAPAQTVNDWAINITTGAANESDDLTFVRTSAASSLFSVQPAIDENGVLTFTPAPNENGNAIVTFKLTDDGGTANGGDDESAEKSFTIVVNAIPDKPVIGGTIGVGGTDGGSSADPLSDASTGDGLPGEDFLVFNTLTVTDVDDNKPTAESLDLTVTISKDSDQYGIFSIAGWTETEDANNYYFTLNNQTVANAQTALRTAVFQPAPNAQPVDIYSFSVEVDIVDDYALSATPLSGSLYVESVNDPVEITATVSPDTITDAGLWRPFRLNVFDPDPGETFELTMSETSPTSRGTLTLPSDPITGDAAALVAGIQDVAFAPVQQSMLVTATFDVEITEVHPDASKESPETESVTLNITFDNDAPQLSGVNTELIRVTDDPQNDPVSPFATVTISDADPGQEITVNIELDDAAKGSLSGPFDVGNPGRITGTAAEVTDKLRQVTFEPTSGRSRDGGSETVILTLIVSDGGSTLTNDQTRVEVTSVNGVPLVQWDVLAEGNAAGSFPLQSSPALIAPFPYIDPDLVANPEGLEVTASLPFEKVDISDDGELVVTVAIDDPAKGTFLASSLGGFAETAAGSGIFTMTGTPATIEADLEDIIYVPSDSYLFPPGEPGRTNFSISAADAVLNVTSRILPIVLISDSRNFLVTTVLDDPTVPGTLRHALVHAKNNDVITFALATYPAVIRLSSLYGDSGTMVLDRHLTFRGPGADKLTITGDTNANGNTDSGDVQLMQVLATVRIKGVKLARGFGLTGGAAAVGRIDSDTRPGELILEDCVISNCLASQWGGAIDVYEGSLTARRCVFEGNRLNVSSGLGGGAVSLYTDEICTFENCTFTGNNQGSPTGYGGGAIYVENFTASQLFQTWITHCTFAANLDAADKGSSIHSNVANTRVLLTNTIFNDGSARNLQVAGSGEIVSVGGNLSDDNTATTLIQGGTPQQVYLLSQPTDQRAVNPLLGPLEPIEGPSMGYRLLTGSPAIGMALPDVLMLDQRGVFRSGGSDSGAVDASALGRMLIHEIFVSEDDRELEFIEFFNPRDQGPVDLAGYQVRVNGIVRHTFSSLVVQPGFGVVLAGETGEVSPDDVPAITVAGSNTPLVLAPAIDDDGDPGDGGPDDEDGIVDGNVTVGGVVVGDIDADGDDDDDGGLGLPERGTIELLAPTSSGLRVVESVSYVAIFANSADLTTNLDYSTDSITLAPQGQGAAFVPNSVILAGQGNGVDLGFTGSPISPGADATGTPFGEPNARPFAVADRFEINEDDLAILDVVGNDVDADGTDILFVVDLDTALTPAPLLGDAPSLITLLGAPVDVDPVATPLRGERLIYNPRTTFNSLPAGARVTDTFAYSIIDVGGGPVSDYDEDGGTGNTLVIAPSHRLLDGDDIEISGCDVPEYNGPHTITYVDEDSFIIPEPFNSTASISPTGYGQWLADDPRTPTDRSQNLVEVIILGRNDPPEPVADSGIVTDEDSVLRIFGDRQAGDAVPSLDTDVLYPMPRSVEPVGILRNDDDPDSNDKPFTQLSIVGVCQVTEISAFSGVDGESPVTVSSTGHGLADGDIILISGYNGHPSYNTYHEVTVVDGDSFTIPITFVEEDPPLLEDPMALWTQLDDTNRFQTESLKGATVLLEIRADRTLTNIVYNARSSTELNTLADGESTVDTFYYAVEDTSGAVSVAKISVSVDGVNDAPVPTDDPPGLVVLDPFVPGGSSLPETAGNSTVLYTLPVPGSPGMVNVTVQPPGVDASQFVVIPGVDWTTEDLALPLPSSRFLDNDGEVDGTDVLTLTIGPGQDTSLLDADISLNGDASVLTYDPTGSDQLQALAFKERVIDVVTVGVFDGIATVPTSFIVVVEGRNDSPVAADAGYTVDERTLLTVGPPGLIDNGTEIDQNVTLPDNRKFLLPQEDLGTTVFGARVDYILEPREGLITGFAAVGMDPNVTLVESNDHGLQTGEEVQLPSSDVLTGQYLVTRVDDHTFTIPVPFDAAFAALGGSWRVLASTFLYDPRASVFAGPTGEPSFTLQGLGEGQSYVDTFEYTILDGSHLFANDDIYRIEVDTTDIQLKVLDNDASLDGIATSRTIVSVGPPSAGGTVSIELPALPGEEASLIYTPETGFVGDEVFTYTIEDDLGNRDTALVTARVTIDRLNGNLRANPDAFTVAAGQTPLLSVLANDSIIPATGDPLTLDSISVLPDAGGTAVVEGGRVRYTPDPGATVFPYTETFSYVMSGGGTATAETTVNVLVVEQILNLRDDSFGVPAGSSGVTLNVLENDNVLPGNGEDLEIVSTTVPTAGTVTIVNGDALSYSPPAGFLGTATFSYTAEDGFGGSGTAMVTVNVGYLTTNPDIFAIPFDDSGTAADDGDIDLDVLANDSVLQGGLGGLTITGVTPVNSVVADALGEMNPAGDNLSLVFTREEDAVGQADFEYTVSDSSGRTATGLVTVVVISGGVRASSDYFTVQTDSTENELTILSNDLRLSILPGSLSIASIGTGPDAPDQGGTVEISADFQRLVYTPAPGFQGTESFTYTTTDGDDSDTARVSVRVTPGAMVAADDDFLVFRGSTDNRLAVLLNDRVIPDGGQLLFITATGLDAGNLSNPPNRGTLSIIEGGAALSYTPSPDNTVFPYTETFTYEISSGGTARAEGLITLEVVDREGVRDLETNNDIFTVRSDTPGTELPVLANDSVLPASAEDWAITQVSPPTVNVCSNFLFMPSDFLDPDDFADTLAAQATDLTVFLWANISPASQGLLTDPGASDADLQDALAVEFNTLIQGGSSIYDATRFGGVALRTATQALIDQGATGDSLVVLNRMLLEDAFPAEIRRAPGGGAVQIVSNTLVYTPVPGFVGTVRFFYDVSDGLGGTGTAEVIVKVGDVSVSDDFYTVLAGEGPVSLDVTANDGVRRTSFPAVPDPAQADFTLTALQPVTVDPLAAGTAMVVDGEVEFVPDAGFTGIAMLTYWVEDDGSCTYPGTAYVDVRSPLEDESTAEVSVTVTGINDEPMLLDADPSAIDDTMQNNPFASATVIEWDEQRQQIVTLTITYDPIRGTLIGDFTEVSPGVLQFIGTAEEITAALRALVFTPTINRIPVGTTEDTLFSVSMDDGFVATPVVVDTAVVTVTPVNDPPVLTGTVASQPLYQYSWMYPFSGVDINDVDDLGLQNQTVTVQIDDPIKGQLTELGGFVETVPGTYVVSGTPAAVSTAIRGLLFTPTPADRVTPGAPEVAQFTISVDDGFAPPVVDASTSVVVLHGQVDKLLPLDGTGADQSEQNSDYGNTVAISGDTLAVGSPFRDGVANNEGRVFVYERNSGTGLPWGQVAELTASDAAGGDQFGDAVGIDGDWMVVGAPGEDTSGGNTGAVYVFQRDSVNPNAWSEVAKLLPPTVNGSGGDGFGSAVAIDGDTILVGSPFANLPGAPRSGRAFVFRRILGTWTAGETLIAADNRVNNAFPNDSERFGASVDLEGDTAVVGSPRANLSGTSTDWDYGAVYVFTRTAFADAFTEQTRLDEFSDPDGQSYSGFGYSVSLSGDRLAIGIYSGGSPVGNFKPGRARIHERNQDGPNQWGLVQKFTPFNGGPSTHFGHAVAVSGDLLMIGSPGADQGSLEPRGAVDVYRFGDGGVPTWSQIDRFMPGAEGADDRFGHSLAFDGFTGVSGAIFDGVNPLLAPTAGSAYVYQFQYDLGPRLVMPPTDLMAEQNELFEFILPAETFRDPIYIDDLIIGVELSDGSPLPVDGWLSFDPVTGTFSGTPTAAERRDYALVLYAVNPLGTRFTSGVFNITVAVSDDLQAAYDIWVATQFPPGVLNDPGQEATVWGMNANPDGDGPNILDMLFGTSATTWDPPQMTFVKVDPSGGELTFPLSDGMPPGTWRVQWSLDLVTWFDTDVSYTFGPSVLGVRETIALVDPPGNPIRLFVRIVTD
ncbi:integrin alphabeta-propellor repeat protein [Haloferula helveola]|uniref:Integrin alphabeta-propellor repeat protein n=1 Tax=Haloferula helveola TaxID=490095 RepID=A0ABM7RB50_9BACT|nr:integrin alphabeta-propellor repeat protein [Haloferula helveola]